jgi:hypothetical protein
MGKNIKRFLTVYTVSVSDSAPEWPTGHLVAGSFLSRGKAIRYCADYVLQRIETIPEMRCIAEKDEVLSGALLNAGLSDDDISNEFNQGTKVCFELSRRVRNILRPVIVDKIGGDGCFILKAGCGRYEYRFDVDENDVVGKGGIQLWTCVTTGHDSPQHDPEWEQAFPEVFMSSRDAVDCAINDLLSCLDGYEEQDKKDIVAEAREALDEEGWYEFELNDSTSRRWDVWSTPLDIGQGSGKIQRVSE